MIKKVEKKKRGCVYFFRHVGLTPVKIGYSTNASPLIRFEQFKTYAPYGAELIGFIRTSEPLELETLLHLKYATKRLMGEWFEISDKDIKNEILIHSEIEDVKQQNEFLIGWCKKIEEVALKEDPENEEIMFYENLIINTPSIIESIVGCREYTITLKFLMDIVVESGNKKPNRQLFKKTIIKMFGNPSYSRWSSSKIRKKLAKLIKEEENIKNSENMLKVSDLTD